MGTPNFYPEKKTKFFSGLKAGVPRVPPITTDGKKTASRKGVKNKSNYDLNEPNRKVYFILFIYLFAHELVNAEIGVCISEVCLEILDKVQTLFA